MQDCYKIRYIDSYPGAGKTHWAISKMTRYLLEHIKAANEDKEPDIAKFGQLFIYVAPTNALINEISSDLKKKVYEYIFNRTNDEELANEYMVKASNRIKVITSESLSTTYIPVSKFLTFAGRAYNEQCQSLHTKFSEKFQSSQYKFEPFSENISELEYNKYPTYYLYNPGDILFITQASFWTANYSDNSKNKTFYSRSATRVIIDEARSCNCDCINIDISAKAYEYISSLCNSKNTSLNEYHKLNKELFFKKDTVSALMSELSFTQYSSLYQFLETYESASFFIKYNIKSTKTSTPIKASFVVVQIPYAALTQWQDIVLMSAFFKQSQLYAVIKCSKNIDSINYNFKLANITKSVLDSDRVNLLYDRLKEATITWVFDNYNNISKRVYDSGLVVNSDEYNAKSTYHDIVKQFAILKSNELSKISQENSSKEKETTYVRFNNVKDFLLHGGDKTAIKTFANDNPQVVPYSPIEAAIRRSIDYAREWTFKTNKLFKKNKSVKTFNNQAKQTILINFNKTLGYSFKKYQVWNILPSNIRESFTPLTIDARGLNTYKQFSIIAVLSAFNIPPDIKAWFDQYCSESIIKDGKKVIHCWYDQYQDVALGQVIQTMMRCSLRDTTIDNKVLIILSTKKIAYSINSIFNKAFKLVNPNELFPNIGTTYSLVHSSLTYEELSDEIKNELKSKKSTRQKEYSKTDSFLKANIKTNRKELSKEDECYKAYKIKYYDESPLRRKYVSLCNNRRYIEKKIKSLKNESYDTRVFCDEYQEKLDQIEHQLEQNKADSVKLLAQVKKDFKEKFLNDPDAVYNDVYDYIEKVDSKRRALANYYENKLRIKQNS